MRIDSEEVSFVGIRAASGCICPSGRIIAKPGWGVLASVRANVETRKLKGEYSSETAYI